MKVITFLILVVTMMSCTAPVDQTQSGNVSEMDFSLNFFRTVLEKSADDVNVSVSPYSAGVALSMLSEGALGETKVEMDNALGGCMFRRTDLGGNDTLTVTSANSVWIDNDFAPRNTYVDHLAKEYGAQAYALDFADPSTLRAINNWCSEHTAGRINQIIKELTPQMVMILANALYFKAPWEYEFSPSSTREAVFNGSAGEQQVPFMSQKRSFEYAEYAGNQMIELPYIGGRYSMYIFLPSESMGVEGVEKYITADGLRQVLPMMKKTEVNLKMPRFRLETDMGLVPVLEAMGIRTAFTPAADLGGIARGPLAVSDVLQKTFIEVGEKGTEAAAVTAAIVNLTSVRPVPVQQMVLDRPFFYMIADMEAERILFAGRVMNI